MHCAGGSCRTGPSCAKSGSAAASGTSLSAVPDCTNASTRARSSRQVTIDRVDDLDATRPARGRARRAVTGSLRSACSACVQPSRSASCTSGMRSSSSRPPANSTPAVQVQQRHVARPAGMPEVQHLQPAADDVDASCGCSNSRSGLNITVPSIASSPSSCLQRLQAASRSANASSPRPWCACGSGWPARGRRRRRTGTPGACG